MNKRTLLFIVSLAVTIGGFSQNKLTHSKHASKISTHLKTNKHLYHLTELDIADIYINKEFFSKKSKVTHSYLNQAYKGIKIYNAISNVAIKHNKVLFFKNKFETNIDQKTNSVLPSISALEAIQKAAVYLKLNVNEQPQIIESNTYKKVYINRSLSQEDIPVELVYCKMPDGSLRLSWDLNIYPLDGKHWWSMRVDALTGAIIEVNDWVVSCNFGHNHLNHNLHKAILKKENTFSLFNATAITDGSLYNVFSIPSESPNHGPLQVLINPADDTASPFGWHDTNGINGPEFTITRGNNVWAQEDINGDNGNGNSPDGTSSLNFNFALNTLEQAPLGYLNVSTTNLFYVNNIMHDIWYHYGFDEASGNFQENNYGNGGLGGDSVFADAQDGERTNNANFITPPEGSNPRMQMFLFSENGPLGESLTINGGTLNGSYAAANPSNENRESVGKGNITRVTNTPITANLTIVDDNTAIPEEGCNPLVNAANIAGKIAVIRRGSCNFIDKIQHAQNAGAVAVIIANHDNPTNDPNYQDYVKMFGITDPAFTIPSIFINFSDGDAIISTLNSGEIINATIIDAGPYETDTSLDNGIIIHEYGHGISNRLTGGSANSNCLSNNFQMGEGWSDWFTLMLTMKPTDSPTDGRGLGTYTLGQDIDGQGIRRRKYSTDFSINEYTFAATNDDTQTGTDPDSGDPIYLNESVHYIGTLWATMLWDLTWAYIDKYGFDPDLYNGNGGNNKIMDIVIEGLKLQGCNPNFTDGRDGILAADIAITGGEDQCLIWDVFARRGLGVLASEGDLLIFNDQIEDFTIPNPSEPSLANCTSTLSVEKSNLKDYNIYPNPVNNKLTISTHKNLGNVKLELIDINGRKVLFKSTTLNRNIELNISTLQSGLYVLKIYGEQINTNHKIIKN